MKTETSTSQYEIISPTLLLYSELQQAFNHFNRFLFNAKLPECIITLQRESKTYGYYSVQRFIKHDKTKIDEIAMNPEYFAIRTIPETLSTLVHEMVHLQQQHFGSPGRGRYHNHEWANWMEYIGLIPTNTGQIGGKRTGDRISHYILKDGKFDHACQRLLTTDYQISWMDRFPPLIPLQVAAKTLMAKKLPMERSINMGRAPLQNDEMTDDNGEYPLLGKTLLGTSINIPNEKDIAANNRSNRIKYYCKHCKIQVWGKPHLNLKCGDCDLSLSGKY